MRNLLGVSLTVLLASYGCSNETMGREVERSEQALRTLCEEGELVAYAQVAVERTSYALAAYEADEYNETVVKYFGEYYDHDILRARLAQLIERGASPDLQFICQEASVPECQGDAVTAALWTRYNEWEQTDGWTIRACGGRFWIDYIAEPDLGGDKDSIGTASRVGVMVHELAHLTGAVQGHSVQMREQLVIEGALNSQGSIEMVNNAEAFRFYIMNVE